MSCLDIWWKAGELLTGSLACVSVCERNTKNMMCAPQNDRLLNCRLATRLPSTRFMRQRTDKSFPNSLNTDEDKSIANVFISTIIIKNVTLKIFLTVFRSIREPVTKERLEDFVLNLRGMPPSSYTSTLTKTH